MTGSAYGATEANGVSLISRLIRNAMPTPKVEYESSFHM